MDVYGAWNKATTELPWGVQSVFYETLKAVEAGQIKLTYGADYSSGSPCLVNAAATMLQSIGGVGGVGVPSNNFSNLVRAFDAINNALYRGGVNDSNSIVSPLAADILLHNFGKLKDQPIPEMVDEATKGEAFANNIYREPSDADLTRDWLNALEKDAVCNIDLSEILHADDTRQTTES